MESASIAKSASLDAYNGHIGETRPLPTTSRQRKILVIVLSICLLVLFLGLAGLNAFNLGVLDPSTTGQIFVFTGLSALAFVLFITALVLLARNVLKLYADQHSRGLGARLRTRMLTGAILLSLLPVTFMFVFSYGLMNRAVDRWFSHPAAQLRDDAIRVPLELSRYIAANATAEASDLASSLVQDGGIGQGNLDAVNKELRSHEMTLQGGFVLVYEENKGQEERKEVARFHVPAEASSGVEIRSWLTPRPAIEVQQDPQQSHEQISQRLPLAKALDQAIHRSDQPILVAGGSDYSLGSAWIKDGGLVVVALPLPYGMRGTVARLQEAGEQYWMLFRLRKQIRATYLLLLLMISTLTLFASSWLALHLSKEVTRPVEALADAMEKIAQGHYDHRVDTATTEELGELMQSFNMMAADLENSRRMVEQSTLQVYEANSALETRRRELETMLQALPNGVVMLDADRRIGMVNRAFSEMLDPGGQRIFNEMQFESAVPVDMAEMVDRLIRRSHRMGTASAEIEMQSPAGVLNIAATVALLETVQAGERISTGYVLVLENATELLRAQKQLAWKEVAQRVAHEIKNPLTPISLSAEQIRRHIVRLGGLLEERGIESPSVAVIHRSSEVVSGSVESMRSLVNQFSALAEFPTARPRAADLNTIVENALALFAGRLRKIQVVRSLSAELPLVMADPEALKRALSNLIDNAAEAMEESLLREIHLSTGLSDTAGMVSLVVADTGPGVTDEMRERLFMPYFSTKQRGSGLGLTISAKIVQDHMGTIRVEKNSPTGARFIIDIPIALPGVTEDDDVGVRVQSTTARRGREA